MQKYEVYENEHELVYDIEADGANIMSGQLEFFKDHGDGFEIIACFPAGKWDGFMAIYSPSVDRVTVTLEGSK